MSWLPKPTVFSEGQRSLMVWTLIIGGALVFSLAVAAMMIAWQGGWAAGTDSERLDIISRALLGALALLGIVFITLAIGGPVGKFEADVFGAHLNARGDDDQPTAEIRTVTTVRPGTAPSENSQ